MKETYKEMILEWLAATFIYLVIYMSFRASSSYFFQFVFGLLSATISIGAYLITNQQKEHGDVLRLIIVTAIYKNMMSLFVFVALLLEIDIPFNAVNIRVQLNMLDLWCICICYIYLWKHINTFLCTLLIGLGFCLCTLLGGLCLPHCVSVIYTRGNVMLEVLMMVIHALVLAYVLVRKEIYCSKSYLAFLLFLGCKLLNSLIVVYYYITGDSVINMPFIICRTMEYYYILKCSYLSYWEEPWKEKLLSLNKVEYCLSDNAYYRDMIVNLSHELKTPINVISSATELLKLNCEHEEEVMDDLKEIRMYCNETMSIIGDMIDIHKLRAGYTKIERSTYNLVALIENVVEAYSKQYKEANLLFNPKEEEMDNQVDQQLFQKMILYLIYTMLKNRKESSELYIEIREQGQEEIVIQFSHSHMGFIEDYLIGQTEVNEDRGACVMAVELLEYILKLHEMSMKVNRRGEAIEISLCMTKRKYLVEPVILEESNIMELVDAIRTHYVIE